jgi:hypothetical protein
VKSTRSKPSTVVRCLLAASETRVNHGSNLNDLWLRRLISSGVNHQLESRMQKICHSGSEGGAKLTFVPTPIFSPTSQTSLSCCPQSGEARSYNACVWTDSSAPSELRAFITDTQGSAKPSPWAESRPQRFRVANAGGSVTASR